MGTFADACPSIPMSASWARRAYVTSYTGWQRSYSGELPIRVRRFSSSPYGSDPFPTTGQLAPRSTASGMATRYNPERCGSLPNLN